MGDLKLGTQRSNSASICYYRNHDENGKISKIRGTHFKGVAIVNTTTEEGKRRVQSSLGKFFDEASVNSAVDVLNLMVRRSDPCRKPSAYRVQAIQNPQQIQEDVPGSRSLGPFVSRDTAYLSLITPSEMASLETGCETVIERPYIPHWIERVNAASGENGTPRYASVMTMTRGAPSMEAKVYACKRCLVVGQKLQFTLDPTDTCEAPEEHDSSASQDHQTPPTDLEPICENVATTISSMHCCLESILCRAEGMSTEELATLKGILGDIKSLVVPRPCPTPERTDPSGWDAVREATEQVADDPRLLERLKTFVRVVDEGPTSDRYQRARLQVLLAEVVLDERARARALAEQRDVTSAPASALAEQRDVTSAPASALTVATPSRSKRRRSTEQCNDAEENKENDGELSKSPRTPLAVLGVSARSSENSQ